jgi:uncharacterized protein YgbK (DUF1537 family)
MTLLLGAIADDFTGATDLASMLTRAGMRTILKLDPPASDEPLPEAEAVVVALKSRTAPVAEAVAGSLASWRWMAAGGARQCYFKYCSTFDSTPQGNIGPVAEALMAETGATQTIYCPAFPENGRTIYQGKPDPDDRRRPVPRAGGAAFPRREDRACSLCHRRTGSRGNPRPVNRTGH